MRRGLFIFVALVVGAAATEFACTADTTDNTIYGPPDSGAAPDADYCVSDFDCPPDQNGNQFACGFPIAQACEARGVCVGVVANGTKCESPNYCGCEGDFVTTCPLVDQTYVRNGPTNGATPKLLDDGGLSCAP